MPEQDFTKVPGKENYTLSYLLDGRLFSYAHQIHSVLLFEPRLVLEVGIGTGMVSAALRAVGIEVTTVDCQSELKPDIVASVTSLPLADDSVDICLCCQVLEHLPFGLFEAAIKELARVAASGIVLSLPDVTPYYEVRLRLPKLGSVRWAGTRRYRVPEAVRDRRWQRHGHYWEIGYPDTPLNRIRGIISANDLNITRTWRISENPYHRFFIIRVNKDTKSTISGERDAK